MEVAVGELYGSYVRTRASPEVGAFAASTLAATRNPKPGKFLEIASRFSPTWKTDLEAFMAVDGRGDAIESIMNHRHQIAHGKNSNITLAGLREYYRKSVAVLEYVEAQCV
jgi:hypothetical protein